MINPFKTVKSGVLIIAEAHIFKGFIHLPKDRTEKFFPGFKSCFSGSIVDGAFDAMLALVGQKQRRMLTGKDYIGIVPEGIIPCYCSSMFPGEKIIDFMNLPYLLFGIHCVKSKYPSQALCRKTTSLTKPSDIDTGK